MFFFCFFLDIFLANTSSSSLGVDITQMYQNCYTEDGATSSVLVRNCHWMYNFFSFDNANTRIMTTVMAIKACIREIIILSYGSPKKVNSIGATKIIRNEQTARTIAHTREINSIRANRGKLLQRLEIILYKY